MNTNGPCSPDLSGCLACGIFYEPREILTPAKSEGESRVLDTQVRFVDEKCRTCHEQLRSLVLAKTQTSRLSHGFFDVLPLHAKDAREIVKGTAGVRREL